MLCFGACLIIIGILEVMSYKMNESIVEKSSILK